MSPVPLLRPREVVAAFERLGWEVARQRSSHIINDETGAYRHAVDSEPPPSCPRNATQSDCEGGFTVKGNYVLIEDVPAGVCKKYGTRHYSANVLKTIEESIRGHRKAERKVRVPVYSL